MQRQPQQLKLLEIKNLTISSLGNTGYHTIIDDLSISVNKGETLGIVGESGSGKSVTALSLLQLLHTPSIQVNSGEILYNSQKFGEIDLLKLRPSQIRGIRGAEIGMIFQDPMSSLNPVYTCGNQMIETILEHQNVSAQEACKRALNLFEKVKLTPAKKIFRSYPHQISGGQKQRVMIAMALACEPSLLIADEPTTALDVTVQKSILELVQELNNEFNTSTLFISHDLAVIAEMADRVAVMYKGKIVEQGSVWDIFENPQHPYTKGLLACRPRLDIKFKRLPVLSDFVDSLTESGIGIRGRYASVGEAIIWNKQTEDEIKQRNQELASQKPILSVRNLETHFPVSKNWLGKPTQWMKAVDDVSFDVFSGETLGLVGESGCGKTTLGRSILQLIKPSAGEIIFEGKDITKLSEKQLTTLRKDIQIIFQDPYASLNPRHTVGEAIMEPMRVHNIYRSEKERKIEAIKLLERVNLNAAHFNRYPHEFSGGQRQRISIARTLAVKPKFIICDESVSALDVSVQATVLNLLNELRDEFNFTYIFISHDLAVVKFIADRIMVMNEGKIVEIDFAENIYKNPKEAYTQKLIDAIPRGDLQDIQRAMLKRLMQKRERKTVAQALELSPESKK
ncbi:ABC transporter ATP-binding protein [Limibacter armeniacum]|uniref:ABC transporter ATP-binding protein n=1 Tax=Limibacter armeniacum TaxID=466084 RepID=UPI002FE583D4